MEFFKKIKEFLICVDSDGCVIDSMDIKHKTCFGPCVIDTFGLDTWKDELLSKWDDINLYTISRGINRFLGLRYFLEYVDRNYTHVEGIDKYIEWAGNTKEFSILKVEEQYELTGLEIFAKVLRWSNNVNVAIKSMPKAKIRPFERAKAALTEAHKRAHIAVVSSANSEAVHEEWRYYGLWDMVDVCFTQELGTKADCIERMLLSGFPHDKLLMIGDAMGDLNASRVNEVLFYPILAGHENTSWTKLIAEALPKFYGGNYQGAYQQKLIEDFKVNLGCSL